MNTERVVTMLEFFNEHGIRPKIRAFYSNLGGRITQIDKLTERTFRAWDRNGYACLVSDYEEITIKESK